MAFAQSELKLRVVSALVLAILAFAALWAGGLVFGLFVSITAFIVFLEWTAIIGLNAFDQIRFRAAALLLVPLLILVLFGTIPAILGVCVCAVAVYLLTLDCTKEAANWTAFATVYCGLAAVSLVNLRNADQGAATILLLFAIVWGTDIGAYFVGRKLGGPKLAPKISPGKTQSGAVGGLLVAAMSALVVAVASAVVNPWFAVVVAVLVSIISQLGDLFESYLKRRFNVKDSGTILPGHGGMFDRVDGLMPAAIALSIIFTLF
jgi:phosphatidate cytidylyltransferase